jgi:hypothetical protein
MAQEAEIGFQLAHMPGPQFYYLLIKRVGIRSSSDASPVVSDK